MKKYIPNALTVIRMLGIPFLIYLAITKNHSTLVALSICIAFTDAVDGFLARRWNVTSKVGALLDTIADKFFAATILSIIAVKFNYFLILIVLEGVIALVNIRSHNQGYEVGASVMGKVKTILLFVTMIFGLIVLWTGKFEIMMFIMASATVFLQGLTIADYKRDDLKVKNIKKTDK